MIDYQGDSNKALPEFCCMVHPELDGQKALYLQDDCFCPVLCTVVCGSLSKSVPVPVHEKA